MPVVEPTAEPVTALRLHPDDNVVCLLRAHAATERPVTEAGPLPPLSAEVPLGHKVATAAIPAGAEVIKYGAPIGHATRDIAPGDHVHLHNLAGAEP